MAVPLTIRRRLERKLPRISKHCRRWVQVVSAGRRPDTRVVLVVGSQRSGTRLPIEVLDYSDEIISYSEGSAPFFRGVLLQPIAEVERLARRSAFPVVALKPICETHRIIELLERFPGGRAIWIFRNYQDAVNSASIKWRSGRESVRRLAAGELQAAGWRAGGLTPAKLELVRKLYRDDLSLHEANAIMWYLRNGLFFDLQAHTRPDVLLVRYEDLVTSPQRHGEHIFDFVGMSMPRGIQHAIHHAKGRSRPFPKIADEIRLLCEGLQERLLLFYASRDHAAPLREGTSHSENDNRTRAFVSGSDS